MGKKSPGEIPFEAQASPEQRPPKVYTIGHSTHPFEKFLRLLEGSEIRVLADVRSYPRSRRHPQFNQNALSERLAQSGIRYVWLGKRLGGLVRRDLGKDSPNTALPDDGFRSYADRMLEQDFLSAVEELETIARESFTAYLCAEADPNDCHRNLLSDFLVARGWEVLHILKDHQLSRHVLHPSARPVDGKLFYDRPRRRHG